MRYWHMLREMHYCATRREKLTIDAAHVLRCCGVKGK